jgi:two-component system LytT family response regulator
MTNQAMNRIRTLVIDDEPLAREEMKNSLADFPFMDWVGEAANAEEGMEQIKRLKPDLLLLDIQMPGKSGFDLLTDLAGHPGTPEIIFVTAFDQYAVRAFDINALDYLLKPVRRERLEKALDKLLHNWVGSRAYEQHIFIKDGERCYFVAWKDVFLIESMGNYARLHFGQESTYLKRSLNQLESTLDPSLFFRISRTQIINLTFISHIHALDKGKLEIRLHKGGPLPVSSRQSVLFKRLNRP